ncbi:MAG TPA: hypothetical protein VLB04_13310, partial [Methanotrichaceae archaeon]|nr:hypothetical protein [Methanotrichaceae archaeon]
MERSLIIVAAAASFMIVITGSNTMIMITGIRMAAGATCCDIILRAANDETCSPIIVHIIDYRLAEKLGVLRAHVDL